MGGFGVMGGNKGGMRGAPKPKIEKRKFIPVNHFITNHNINININNSYTIQLNSQN